MNRREKAVAAFTLVELLVAAAITVVIVVFLGALLASLMNTSSRSNNRIDAFRDARAALQMMQRDLSGLVKAQPAAYFQIDTDLSGPDIRQIYGLVSAKNQPVGIPATAVGDLCAVRYYCAWDSTARAYSLHRYFRNSDLTIKTFQGNISGATLKYTDTGSLYYPADGTDEAIAAYVWGMRVTAFDGLGAVMDKVADSKNHDTTRAPYMCDPDGSTKALPAAVEISFNAMSPVAARTVISATAGRADAYLVWQAGDVAAPNANDKQLFETLIKPYMYEFRTRVALE